jgi:hypothetical protein
MFAGLRPGLPLDLSGRAVDSFISWPLPAPGAARPSVTLQSPGIPRLFPATFASRGKWFRPVGRLFRRRQPDEVRSRDCDYGATSRLRIPAACRRGGLISYRVDLLWCYHRAATHVHKILAGSALRTYPLNFPQNSKWW